MMGWENGGGSDYWPLMMIGMVVFWALVVVAIVAIFRGSRPPQTSRGPGAIGILDERLARGEIDAAEYRARKDALEGR